MRSPRLVAPCLLVLVASGPAIAEPADDRPPPAASQADAQPAPAATDTIDIVGHADGQYLPRDGVSALKIPVPLSETPVTMQVLTPELIDDQQAFRLQDALRNVAGVNMLKNEGKGQEYDTSTIRGFSQRPFRSGLRTLGSDTIDMSSVERVEVIKGPDAVTFGAAEPGGVVNIITKGARLAPFSTVATGTAGSYDSHRLTVDAGGRLIDGADVAVRMNAAVVGDRSFRDHVYHDAVSVSPAALWQIGERTSLDVRGTYKHEQRMLDPGIYLDAGFEEVASHGTFLGDPATDGVTVDDALLDATLSHAFLPSLEMRTRAVYHDLFVDLEAIRTRGSPDEANMIGRRYDGSDIDLDEYVLSNDFILTLGESGTVSAKVVLGADFRHMHKVYTSQQDSSLSTQSTIAPVYDFDPGTANVEDGSGNENGLSAIGGYTQGVVGLFDDALTLMAGGRFDAVDSSAVDGEGVETEESTTGLSWQAGVLYKVFAHLYPYATVGSAYDPQGVNRVDVDGNYLDPETGLQYEGGFKAPFFDGAFTATASVYRIDKKNVAIADPDNEGFRINGGELSSQGLELTAGGDITPSWGVYAAYAYTDTRVEKSDNLPEGEAFQGIPLHAGSLWVVYSRRAGLLEGLRLGGGVFFTGERNGDDEGEFALPAYATVDVMVGYRRPLSTLRALNLQVNVKNVLDQAHLESGSGYAYMPGPPRTVAATLGVEF